MRARIDAVLPESAALREALAHEHDLRSRVRAGSEEMLTESANSFETRTAIVMAQATSPLTEETSQREQGFPSALSFLNPRRWSPAVALTLAIAVPVQAAIIAGQSSSITQLEKENFELASGPCANRDRSHGIILQLKDNASWTDISKLLDTEALVIVESAAFGVLTVRGEKDGAGRDETIKTAQAIPDGG